MENKKIKNAKSHVYDDIEFKSGLELFCYKQLKENNIPFIYQPESLVLIDNFKLDFECYENIGKVVRDENKKIKYSTKRFDLVPNVRSISYTSDFACPNNTWIIETKGFSNDSFPLRWKLVKQKLMELGFKGILMMPTNQKEILQCIEIIKQNGKRNQKSTI